MGNLLLAVLGGFCIYSGCINILPEKPASKWNFIIFLSITASSCIFSHYLWHFSAFVTVAITLVLIYHFTSLKWLNISCALFGYLFTVTLNYICIWIAQKFFHMSLGQMYQIDDVILLFSSGYCIICFLCTLWLGHLLNSKFKISKFSSDIASLKTIFITMLLLTVFFIFNFSYSDDIGYSYGVIAFNGILFLALFIAVTILMWFLHQNVQKKIQAEHMLHQYEHLQTYTEEVEKLYVSMRGFKHEYVNLLSTLTGYIDKGDITQLKDYFYSEILPLSQAFSESDTRLGSLSHIELLELKTLLSSKLIYAMELCINIELELTDTIRNIPMKSVDLIRVLGIFLDNAIDAALNSNEKRIQLCFLLKEDCMVIILRNSSFPPQIPLARLADWGISSKGAQRGIGLYNAKSILNQYPHILWDMEYQAPYFTQTLTIHQTGEDHL